MNFIKKKTGTAIAVLLMTVLSLSTQSTQAADLESWNDGAAKTSILRFVRSVESARVPASERIAVFDNDGTLWTEQPLPIEGLFTNDRIKALAPRHPEWKDQLPYKAILEGDLEAMRKFTAHDFSKILAATHSGMTTEEFRNIVRDWVRTFKHPKLDKPLKNCVYQPMLEVLTLLRAHGFKTFIVSGGGIDFMRAFVEELYGIPPEQVIGSSGQTRFEIRGGKGVLVKLPKLGSIDDKEGKPVNINLHIGRRPLLAFGNSDGDLQMLQYTDAGPSKSLMLLVHHDDKDREFAYDRNAGIGRLDKALDEAKTRGWRLISMKKDFRRVFPEK